MSNRIQLGDIVRDRISGYTGIATGRTEYLHGCERIAVQPMVTKGDGTVHDPAWFDAPQLEVTETRGYDALRFVLPQPGGPRPDPVRRQDPRR
jgi:hypothetical protein